MLALRSSVREDGNGKGENVLGCGSGCANRLIRPPTRRVSGDGMGRDQRWSRKTTSIESTNNSNNNNNNRHNNTTTEQQEQHRNSTNDRENKETIL